MNSMTNLRPVLLRIAILCLAFFRVANLCLRTFSSPQIFVCAFLSFANLRPQIFVRISSSSKLRPQNFVSQFFVFEKTILRKSSSSAKGQKGRQCRRRQHWWMCFKQYSETTVQKCLTFSSLISYGRSPDLWRPKAEKVANAAEGGIDKRV